MVLNNYSSARAALLNNLNIPEIESPFPIKFLWLDIVRSGENEHTIYDGVHHHSFYEVHFVFEGEIAYKFEDKTEIVRENCALLIPPNTPHKPATQGTNFQKASLAFSIDHTDMFASFPANVYLGFLFDLEIAETIDHVLRQMDFDTAFTPYIISARCLEMLCSVCQKLGVELPQRHHSDIDPRFTVAKKFIHNNGDRLITCDDVAKECCLSTKQLSRIFNRYTKKSLFEYIISERLKNAQKLLSDSHLTIKEIGYSLGFENENGFIAFFKRQSGMTPSAFRKQQGHTKNRYE